MPRRRARLMMIREAVRKEHSRREPADNILHRQEQQHDRQKEIGECALGIGMDQHVHMGPGCDSQHAERRTGEAHSPEARPRLVRAIRANPAIALPLVSEKGLQRLFGFFGTDVVKRIERRG